MKFIIKKTADDQFMNVLVATKGEVLSSTETMKQRTSALKNIYVQMKSHGSSKPIFVTDEVNGTKYKLRLVKNRVQKFGEKKHRTKQK